MAEVRLAVGEPMGRRSTVWKLVTNKNDVYLIARMFGAEAKVSLHASGECQWSATSSWVRKDPSRKNADRHFRKWKISHPIGSSALLVIRVEFPEADIQVAPPGEDLSGVQWLPMPLPGHLLVIDGYITPPNVPEPTGLSASADRVHLASLSMNDGRWFVIFYHFEEYDASTQHEIRSRMKKDAEDAGNTITPDNRGVAFIEYDGGVKGLREVFPFGV